MSLKLMKMVSRWFHRNDDVKEIVKEWSLCWIKKHAKQICFSSLFYEKLDKKLVNFYWARTAISVFSLSWNDSRFASSNACVKWIFVRTKSGFSLNRKYLMPITTELMKMANQRPKIKRRKSKTKMIIKNYNFFPEIYLQNHWNVKRVIWVGPWRIDATTNATKSNIKWRNCRIMPITKAVSLSYGWT